MGQPITVIEKASQRHGVVRFETNRVLTGTGHERYRPGDVIVRVGGNRIDSLDELSGAIDQPRSLWRVEIRRGNRILKLVVPG